MTIFQKIIFVPILSLVIYSGFVIYSLREQQQIGTDIEQLRHDYVPVLVLVKDNSRNFKELSDSLKDAVIAGERRWILDTLTTKQTIEESLNILNTYPHIMDSEFLATVKSDFTLYYENANKLAEEIIKNRQEGWHADERLVQATANYFAKTSDHFQNMEQLAQQRFKDSIDQTYKGLKGLLYWGAILSVCTMVFLLVVTFYISVSTRRNINQLIFRTKSLALGDAKFSSRLERSSKDELGALIYWFNKLSDKLEGDYKQLQTLSITDKLTGLNNRTRTDQYLPNALANAIKKQQPMHLIVIDIDHFKAINDDRGHLTGDRVLQQFAEVLKSHAQEHDYIGRWGGEEFILIWAGVDGDAAFRKAVALREAIARYDFTEVTKVTASFGMTQAHRNDTPESIIARADANLYQAKEKGRNRVVADVGPGL